MKIKTYKYEKVEVSETEIFIPQEPFYCFETGIRRAIRIIPNFTTWQIEQGKEREEIWELDITCVYQSWECKAERFSIRLSDIEGLVNGKDTNDAKSIVTLLLHNQYNTRSKEQFENDLKQVLDKLI